MNSAKPALCGEDYKSLLSNIPGAAYRCLFDRRWTMIFITENIRALSGFPAGDLIKNRKRTYSDIIMPEDRGPVRESIEHAVNSGSPWEIEYRIARKDGSMRWVFEKGRAVKKSGKVEWLDGIILDITGHRIAENARAESEARLSATLDSIADGVISTDASGLVADVNPAAELITGYARKEASGRRLPEIFSIVKHGRQASWEDPAEIPLKEGIPVELSEDTKISTKYGEEKHIADSCAPIKDFSGKIIGAVLVCRDVSDRHRARLKEEFEMKFQRTVADVSTRFINLEPEEFDEAVNSSLAYLGRLFSVDRGYLFKFSHDPGKMDNTHEWCAEGVPSHKDRITDYPVNRMKWLMKELAKLQPVHIPDTKRLPPGARTEKNEFAAQGVRSLLLLPLRRGRAGLLGFIGFDTVNEVRSWPENQVMILQVVAEIIAGAVSRLEAFSGLKKSHERFNMLTRQARAYIWEADSEGLYEYISPAVEDILGYRPDELSGKKHFYDLCPAGERSGRKKSGMKAIREKKKLRGEVNLVEGKDGRIVKILRSGLPVERENGSVPGYLGIDICACAMVAE